MNDTTMPAAGSQKALDGLRVAIQEWEALDGLRTIAWATASTNAQIAAAEDADKDALWAVREAFFVLTRDRNSRDNCHIVGIKFLRKTAEMFCVEKS